MHFLGAVFLACALIAPVSAEATNAAQTPAAVPAASPSTDAAGPVRGNDASASAAYDVLANVFSEPQRKMLDRDSRCHDARTSTDAFVTSDGKALQTGVDAMVALEKCAGLPRVGADWSDFRDYVITAAAALAYEVGTAAGDERLLRRAIDDASHVSGFEASSATVTSYSRRADANADVYNSGHSMGSGPAQSSEGVSKDQHAVAAYSGSYGKIATSIAGAANTRLATLPASHPQQH